MSWEENAKPYLLNDKGTKLNQSETLIQSKDSYLGIIKKENRIHLIYVGYEFLLYA